MESCISMHFSGWWLSQLLWKIWKSIGMMIIASIWKNKSHVPVTTNQLWIHSQWTTAILKSEGGGQKTCSSTTSMVGIQVAPPKLPVAFSVVNWHDKRSDHGIQHAKSPNQNCWVAGNCSWAHNVGGKTIMIHPFRNGLHHLSMVKKRGWDGHGELTHTEPLRVGIQPQQLQLWISTHVHEQNKY